MSNTIDPILIEEFIKDNYQPVEDKPGYVWFNKRNYQMISIETLKASLEEWCKKRKEREMSDLCESDLLVIKVKSGINVKADLMAYWRKEILRQKETGVVVLPWFLKAEVVPKDVEIKFEEDQNEMS